MRAQNLNLMSAQPQILLIAGPNGSGKSTSAATLLPRHFHFLNADIIAQESSGSPGTAADIAAGRVLLEQADELATKLQNFSIETTLATKSLAHKVIHWRTLGYRVHLFFFSLPSADLAVERVAERVRAGGHHVPETTIRRRFESGIRNFFDLYRPLVDRWRMYENASSGDPVLVAASGEVLQPEVWQSLKAEFSDDSRADEAVKRAVRRALRDHKSLSNPIAVWREGKVVILQPHEIIDFHQT